MQGAFCALQGFCTGAHRALGELGFWDTGDTLEIIVARVAEVGCSEAEVDSHRAAVATLVLKEICAVFRTHLYREWG